MDLNGLALPEKLAVVDLIDPGYALREDRLAGPVIPTECRDLAGGQIQIDTGQRLHRAKVLLDAPCLQ